MTEPTLRQRHILVVEDEYLLAYELRNELEDVEAVVVGPVGNLAGALGIIASGSRLDGAILDVNLSGELAWPAAERLGERGVPFVFITGYGASAITPRFAHVPRCEKPIGLDSVIGELARLLAR